MQAQLHIKGWLEIAGTKENLDFFFSYPNDDQDEKNAMKILALKTNNATAYDFLVEGHVHAAFGIDLNIHEEFKR